MQEQGRHPNLVLATFETSALELLFPYPQAGCTPSLYLQMELGSEKKFN
jgi:hypothetical protein